jgi:hypothetical protein
MSEIKVAAKRERRVTTKIKLPEGDSSIGSIVLHIAGQDAPMVYEVDFESVSPQILFAATLAGISNKFAIAYAGEKTPEGVVAAIQKEIDVLETGEFTSRTLKEKAIELLDIVAAWMLSVGADTTDAETVKQYTSSWDSRDNDGKAKISGNLQVIVKLDELQAARRLVKKAKNAVQEELEVL